MGMVEIARLLSMQLKYAGERHRRIFCATAWLYLSGPDGIASLEKYRQSGIGGMGHACELETSFILHLNPSSGSHGTGGG